MNRSGPFNQTVGMDDGTIKINRSGYVNKEYNLWNRNLMTIRAEASFRPGRRPDRQPD